MQALAGYAKALKQQAGSRQFYANDFDKYCALTYDANFKETPLTIIDICEVDLVKDGIAPFDFLLGGFPCQAFSVAGYRQGLNDHKGRGILFERDRALIA